MSLHTKDTARPSLIYQEYSRCMAIHAVVSPVPTPPPDPKTASQRLHMTLRGRQKAAAETCGWYNADYCTVMAHSPHFTSLTLTIQRSRCSVLEKIVHFDHTRGLLVLWAPANRSYMMSF